MRRIILVFFGAGLFCRYTGKLIATLILFIICEVIASTFADDERVDQLLYVRDLRRHLAQERGSTDTSDRYRFSNENVELSSARVVWKFIATKNNDALFFSPRVLESMEMT